MKKIVLIILGVLAAALVAFVAKETLFFDDENPYGSKEISSEFKESLPATDNPEFDLNDFGEVDQVPVADDSAKRIVTEYLVSELDRAGIDSTGFGLTAVTTEKGGTVFQFFAQEAGQSAKIRMDRHGVLSVVELPTK